MKTRWWGVVVLLVGLLVSPLRAAEDLGEGKPAAKSDDKAEAKPRLRAEAKPAAKSDDKAEAKPRFVAVIDYEDFVFVASDRPVLVRLHLRNDGRPYSAAWDDYMKKFFAYFDKNGDGTLDKAEAERAPNMRFLQFQLQGSIGFPYQGQTVPLAQMDTNKDGKVSPAEFADYYRRSGFNPLEFSNNSNQANTDTMTNTLLKHLDANKDGKLSAAELAKAPAALLRLDLDEDEMIALAELMPGGGDNNGFFVALPGGMRAGPNIELGFIEIKPSALDAAAQQVLAHYDKNKNGKLSRVEVGLDETLFHQLDTNRDDQLDAKEFAGFFRRDADLELMVRIGEMEAKTRQIAAFLRNIGLGSQLVRAEVFNPSKRLMSLAAKVRRENLSTLALSFGDAHIGLSVADQMSARNNNLQFYTRLFKQADTDKKGVIDRKKAKTVQFLDEIFPLFDRDGDGKLTLKELNAFLAMQTEGSACRMQLSITAEGRSLFNLLDANTDSRLSVRELRSGWSRLKPLAKSDKGLSRLDIPRRLTVSVGQGQQGVRPPVPVGAMPGVPTRSRKAAPLWFSKMDRNRDGDLSPGEFIGTAEDFRKLDADGDGLISVEEARQFEMKLKKQQTK